MRYYRKESVPKQPNVFLAQVSHWGATFLIVVLILANRSLWSLDQPQAASNFQGKVGPGVVVEEVVPQGEGEKAGLQKGDILLSWSRGNKPAELQSPFDLMEVEIEQAPQGTVTLQGLHGPDTKTWLLGPDSWGIKVRPAFSDAHLTAYLETVTLAKEGKLALAEERWRALVDEDQIAAQPWLRSWLFFHLGELQAGARQWKEADDAYQAALQSAAADGWKIQRQVLRRWALTFEQRSKWTEADKYYQQAAAQTESFPDDLGRALDLDNIGRVAARHDDFTRAQDYFERSLKMRQKLAPGSVVIATSHINLGNLEDDRGDLDKAQQHYTQALATLEKITPGSFQVTTILMGLGNVAFDRGDLAKASDDYSLALEIREKLVPGSIDVGKTLNALGNVAYRRGDLGAAADYYRRSLIIKQKLAPGSLSVASTLANLGNVAHERGDLAQAEDYYRQDLEITEKLSPASLDFAGSLMDLGIICQRRGDLVRAEGYYLQALEIKKRLAPNSLDLAYTLNNLGSVAQDRGDWVRAGDYYRQALEIRQKLAPGNLDVADALNNLGEVALASDDLQHAEDYNRQAFEIKQKLAPGSLDVAGSLENLGLTAQRRGDFFTAELYLKQALALRESVAPNSVATAGNLNRLGVLAKGRGDLDLAEQYLQKALAIWDKVAPQSAPAAESLAGLASINRTRGQLDAAAQLYQRALNAIESQTAQLGGAEEVRAGFRSQHEDLYRGYAELLLSQGKTDLAFRVLEQLRAHTLLETLASAHVNVGKGVDAALLAQERSLQADIGAKADRRIRLLSREHSQDEVKAVEKQISDLTRAYQDLEAQIRFSSPAYAALTQPEPLSAEDVQKQLLDSNALLLEYFLGDERSFLFAISPNSVQAFELPRRSEIEDRTTRLYSLLTARNLHIKDETEQSRNTRVAQADVAYFQVASELSRILLGPVASQLDNKRLLIVGDGALLHIPFSGLPEPREPSGIKTAAPLIIRHEIVNLPSASVLAVLRHQQSRRPQPVKEAIILADPVFSREDGRVSGKGFTRLVSQVEQNDLAFLPESSTNMTRSATDADLLGDGKLYLARLPFSRREADAISTVIPWGKVRIALDFDANRKLAVSGELARYRVVHFATHALVNEKHPDLSGLVLSLVDARGGPQQGFLDLQDIYNMDLDADLVVLSACDTALGKQIEGEGIIGLTRGFMYAGARSVVGTLWKVEDFATAKFMAAFYKMMEQKRMSAVQALRQAQLALWKEKHWSSPYYWAAFTLQGDWE